MILNQNIRGIFFDLYGTLLLYNDLKKANKNWIDAFHSYLSSLTEIDREDLVPVCRNILTSKIARDSEIGLSTYETKIRDELRNIGINLVIKEINELADYSIAVWQKHISPVKEAGGVLRVLKCNYRLALITNFDHARHIYRVLEELQLRNYFEQIIISDEAGSTKPDPEIFNLALKKMSLRNDETAFVGDSLIDDISGAHKCGLFPILINQELYTINHEFETDFKKDKILSELRDNVTVIKSLTELVNNKPG